MNEGTIGIEWMTDFERLARQWAPKIENVLRRYMVLNYHEDDLRQECLIVLNKCSKGFDPDRVGPKSGKKAQFGTYFHRALMNHFGHLRIKERVHNPSMEISLDAMAELHPLDVGSARMGKSYRALLEATKQADTTDDSVVLMDLEQAGLTSQELDVVRGRMDQVPFSRLQDQYGITRGKAQVAIIHAREKLAERR